MTGSSAPAAWTAKGTPELEESDLQYFCAVIEERAGIYLKSSKRDLVKTRLRARIAAHGMNDFAEYRSLLSTLSKNDPEWQVFTNLLTTNKTDFFREPKHFTYLIENILPAWLKTSQKTFQVWSAASSTGEEPYTLAMVLDRYIPKDRDFKIFATDIDTEVLQSAQNAVYSISKRSEIPGDYQQGAIDLGRNEARGWFRIKKHLKEKVTFKQHNLIDREAPGKDFFDLVLCRNVLIYFGSDTVNQVQRKIYSTVRNGGHLFIGHSESFHNFKHNWTPAGPSIFKKGT